ncbi:choice-of-anchor D domain-containing protein [Fulvivirga sp.]|uniref:choice-of-anchor D domain-containing protein n=1 Tax=Fulvivirga sp. TaxID=1931237 RepID=UPI0032EEECA8
MMNNYKIVKSQLKLLGLFVAFGLLMLSFTHSSGQSKKELLGGAKWVAIQSDTCYTSGRKENTRVLNSPFWQAIGQRGGKMTTSEQLEFAGMKTATIIIEFGDGFDLLGADAQPARDAFRFAADIWETEVVSPVPIIISADFAVLPGGVLGQNGSPSITNVPNAPDPSTNYTLALANAIAGFDLSPGTPNGNQTYNTNFTFYFGTDGNTPSGITDFVTVVLHEIGHSMGISGISNGGAGVGNNGGANPRSWDLLVELGDGTPILDLGFGTPEQQAALISGNLFSAGPLAVAALGGTRPKIWAPNPFQGGSSYSHWDEFAFPAGDINSLMSPQVGSGESNFNIGPITRGVLADQGWQLSADLAAQDVGVVAVNTPVSDSDLGNTETVEVSVRNFGIEDASGFSVSYIVDGGTVVTESFTETIPAVSVATFTFATPVDLSSDGTSYSIDAFTTLTGDEDTSNDSIAVTVTNLIPEALLSATEIDFGSLGVGNELTKTITISSVDTGPLAGEVDIESIDVVTSTSGTFTSLDVLDLPITIEPGADFELSFSYQPAVLDADAGVATINTNAGSFDVNLIGQGVEPSEIAVSPASLSSVLEVGETETQFITVSNVGAADLNFSLSFGTTTVVADAATVAAPFQGSSLSARSASSPLKKSNKQLTLKKSSGDIQSATAENSVYIIDDGSQESNIGLNSVNELMWLNAFQTVAGAEVITSISSAVASGAAETPARFILYNDPDNDGDPSNAVYLTETSGVLTNPGEDVFTTVNIDPTIVEGVFFVGVLVEENPTVNAFPMPQDSSSPSQQSSWAISNDVVGEFDVFDLSNNSLPPLLIDDADLAGNWMLRADGQFFSATPLSGTVVQGEEATIEVTFIGSSPGTVTSSIFINNNDPGNSEVEVPITMEVEGVAVTATPPSFNVSLEQGQSTTETLTLSNAGTADVTFSIEVNDLGIQEPVDNLLSSRGFNPVEKRQSAYAGNIFEGSSAIISDIPEALGVIQYETGFEDFLLGDVNAQNGWAGQFGNWTIEDSNPLEGNLHFRGLSDGLGQSVAFSPVVAIGSDPVSSVSMGLEVAGTGVTWDIIPQSPTAESVNTRLRFDPSGTVSVLVNDPDLGGVFVPTGASTPSGYFNIRIDVERATSEFAIYFDNELIFEGPGFAGDIEQLVILSLMEVGGPTFDLDNVKIIDGSSEENSTPAISASVLSGVIPAGGSTDIDVLFDGDRDYGTYRSDFVITLNDNPAIPAIVVDATLNVEGDPTISVDPTVVQEVSDFNKMSTRTVTITNTGGNPLEYDLNVIGADIGVTQDAMAGKLKGITSQEDRILSARVLEKMDNDKPISLQNNLLKAPTSKDVFITIGDTFFAEDFDGGTFPPTGWTTIDNEGNGVVWGFASDTGEGNYSGSGEAATVNSDFNGTAEFDAELITPIINVEGKSNLALKYNVNYQNYAGLDFLDVDLSTDGGATWSTLLSWNEDHGAFKALPGEAVSIPLDSAIAGASEIMVRWRYYDPNTGDYDWYAQIDDVEIVENSVVWLAVNKASGVVPVGGTAEVELTFDPTVVEPGFYVAGIIVNSNAVNTSQVGVVVSMQELNAAEISVNPDSLAQELVAGRSATQTLTIANTGESALDFNFAAEFPNVGEVDEGNSSTESVGDAKRKGGVPNTSSIAAFKAPNAGALVERDFAIEDPVDFSTVLYATNFETFAAGDILGQQGWSGQFVNWVIDTSNPAGGSQHIRSISDGLGQTLAFSPVVPIGTEPISSVSMMVDLQGSDVTWQFIPQSPAAGSVVTRLSFDPDGTASALVADNGGEFQPIAAEVPEGYFEVSIEAERATNFFTIYFDDEAVFTGEGFAGDIEQLVLLSLMEVPGPTLDIDNVQLVDGVIPDPVLSTSPIAGTIPSGGTLDIDVTFNATNLDAGVYENDLVIINNDPLNSPLIVPTTLTVIAPQIIAVSPTELSDTLSVGDMSSKYLTVTNEGVADLIFDINVVGDLVIQDAINSGIASSKDWKNDAAKVAKKALDDEGSLTTNNNTTSDVRSATVAIVYEDFEGESFPPEGWSVVDNEGTGVVWAFAADYGEGNYAGTGEAATVSSDAAGTVEFDTELWTPEIEVDGRTGIVLEYAVNYQNLLGLDFLDVDISTDGGSNWTTILSWNEDHGLLFSGPGEIVSLELDDFIGGAETFIVRWHYYDPNSGDFDWYAQIDDVVIGVPWLTVVNAADTIPGGSSVDVEVKFDATSLQPGLFNTNLEVHSNDLKNPKVTVPASLYVLTPPAIAVEPDTLNITLFEGFETDASFAISNSGETALEYNISAVPGFVSVISGGSGTVEEDASSDVSIDVSAVGLVPGEYQEAIEISSNDPNNPIAVAVINLTVLEFVILDLEMATVCSDDPDTERRWEVTNPNSFDVDAFWFVVGSSVSDSITLAPGVNYFTSTTQTDRPNIVKLRWLDEDDVSNEVQVESDGSACLIESLNLTSVCSNNPDLFRRWRVRNPNPFEVMVNWNVVGTSQSGIIYAAGNNDTFFYTEAVGGANTTIIKWMDQDGVEQQKVKASSGEICDIDNSCAGGEVIAFNQGFKRNGKPIAGKRSDVSNAIGYPEQGDGYNFVSLGFGGSIDIELSSIVVDQPGYDFVVIETSFKDANRSCEDYPESADIYVSENGTDYIWVGNTCRDGSFDIAVAGLMQIEFVRIIDTSDPMMFGGAADGFDLDGIACINAYDSQGTSFVMQTAENNVPDEANEAGIVTFPNPFSERIAVKMDVEEDGIYELIVHDLFGAEIFKGEIESSFGQLDAQIDAIGFANGTYMLTIAGKNNSVRVSHLMIKK